MRFLFMLPNSNRVLTSTLNTTVLQKCIIVTAPSIYYSVVNLLFKNYVSAYLPKRLIDSSLQMHTHIMPKNIFSIDLPKSREQ